MVVDKTNTASLWNKDEGKYQKKSLTNRLYKKQRLYTLRMIETTHVMLKNMLIILIESSLIYKALGLRLRRRIKP